jgi:hypothetical protein
MRAAYRGYVSGGKRAGQVRRLHVIREHGPGDRVAKVFMCGAPALAGVAAGPGHRARWQLRARRPEPPPKQVADERRALAGADLRSDRVPQAVLDSHGPVRCVGLRLRHGCDLSLWISTQSMNALALDIQSEIGSGYPVMTRDRR